MRARYLALWAAAVLAAPACAQDNQALDDAAALAQTPPAFADEVLNQATSLAETPPVFESATAEKADAPVNLLIAAHRTTAQRYSDSWLTSGKPRRRPVAASMRQRRQDDANFTNRTRWLARRIEDTRSAAAPELAAVSTGEEFLRVLIDASRRGPIANLVVYGHAAAKALFMREDRGFYAAVDDVARDTNIVEGTELARASQLRAMGARDLSDLMELVAGGDIRFARNAVIVFAGCGVAGKRDVDAGGIAARVAEIADATVIASIDVTDQSMGRGRAFRDHEYSRRSWVRFVPEQLPERLNTKVIDALKYLKLIEPQPGSPAVASAALSASN